MTDLISRADAIEAVKKLDIFPPTKYAVLSELIALPSAELKQEFESADAVQGEWVDWLGNGNEWECSVCKCSVESHGSIAYNYCPMCGARMKGGAE